MKTRFKKVLSLALTMILVLLAVPFAALPAGAEDAASEPKVVQGLFGVKLSKYQVFDASRSPSFPQGTQEEPSPINVFRLQDPIRVANQDVNNAFDLVSSFENNGYCYFVPLGNAGDLGVEIPAGYFKGNDGAGVIDPFLVEMHYHAADGREAVFGRGVICAIYDEGFLFLYGPNYWMGIYVSTKQGRNYNATAEWTYTPNAGCRVVCDRGILDDLVVGQMLGNGETRAEYYGAPEWVWSDDRTSASAVFHSTESEDEFALTANVTRISFTPGVCLTDDKAVFKATVQYNGEEFTDTQSIVYANTAPGHAWDSGVLTAAASCRTKGKTLYTCTVTGCGASEERTDVPENPDNHVNTEEVAETDSTCYQAGYTAGVFCSDCETWVSGHTEKPLAEHSWQETERVNANCRDEGYVDYACAVENCGETKREPLDVDPDAHSFGIRIHPATCTEQGYTAYTCVFCRYGYNTDEQPALGHDWSDPVWSWNGTSSATATFSCANGDHPQTVTATVTVETVKEPTETEKGKNVYTATVEFEGETYTDTVEKTIPALNDGLCKWCGEDHSGSFWQKLVGFFHSILYFFAHLFGRR